MEKQIKKRFEDEGFGKEAIILCLDGKPHLGHAIATLEQASGSKTDDNMHRTRWAANYVDNFLVSQVTSRLSTYHVINTYNYLRRSGINLPKTRQELRDCIKEYDTPRNSTYDYRNTEYSFRNTMRSECRIQGGYLYPYNHGD